MSGFSKFTFVGRVAKVTPFDAVTKLRVISNYRYKGKDGEWRDDEHAITLTIFDQNRRSYVERKCAVGDLIAAEGRMKDTKYEKDGEPRYETTFVVDEIQRLARIASTENECI